MPHSASSTQRIRQEMRARGEATRPQLARACGLSLVTVNRMVSRLCAAGEIEPVGEVSSGGGRPVQLYRLRRAAAWAALLRLERAGTGVLSCRLELLDPFGARLHQEDARFAHLEEDTLDGWLDGILRQPRRSHRQLLGITIVADAIPLPPTICRHLSERHNCPCQRVTAADALAEQREGSTTIVLSPGAAPLATLYRHGKRHRCGALELLPLPADWSALDYGDHTLVEEMISRLLLTLTCTLAPERFVLHGDFWTERLLRRIRYNLSAKLRGALIPPLHFRRLSEESTHHALHRLALEVVE